MFQYVYLVHKRLPHTLPQSTFHLEVSTVLRAMGVVHVNEFLAEDGLFSVDIAIDGPGNKKIAVEVDGPHHFTANTLQVSRTLCTAAAAAGSDSIAEHALVRHGL